MKRKSGSINKEKSFGQAVIDSLTEFLEASDRDEPITARTVKLNLEPRKLSAEEIYSIREAMGLSQAIFAQVLGVSKNLVQSWEQGKREPSGPACIVLADMMSDPRGWLRKQLAETCTSKVAVTSKQKHLIG